MIRIQSSRPFIEVDGTKHFCERRIVLLAEALLASRGKIVAHEKLLRALGCTKGGLRLYVTKLRGIVGPHAYLVESDPGLGYRMIKVSAAEYEVIDLCAPTSPKPLSPRPSS